MTPKIALVTGASRGIGRGIATALGAAGWHVWMTSGVWAHYVTTALCAGLLRRTPGSVVVTVSFEAGKAHRDNFGVAYSVTKAADDRLAEAMAAQLRAHDVASISLHPGMVRTEGVMQFAEHLDLTGSQSPEGVGRVVGAVAQDPEVLSLTGQALDAAYLAGATAWTSTPERAASRTSRRCRRRGSRKAAGSRPRG